MKLGRKLSAAALAVVTTLGLGAAAAHAATLAVKYTDYPFTSTELANWVPDRTAPTGGYDSVTFADRTDVLEVRLDAASASADPWYQTEGLQRAVDNSDALKVELYIDPSWLSSDIPVRAGLWGVGHDLNGDVSAYPVIEFSTRRADGTTGWRIWDGVNGGWTNIDAPYTAGEWSQLEIFRSADTGTFGITVNGTPSQSSAGGTVSFGAVILNQYNYGTAGADYAVHWSRFGTGTLVSTASAKEDCVNGGYSDFGFTNQGQCIASIVANENSGK